MALTAEQRKFVMDIKYEDISYTLIEGTFCSHYDPVKKKTVPPKISFQEEFDLAPGEYLNKEKVHTNVGQKILNVALYGNTPSIQKVLGYVAKPYNKDTINDTEAVIVNAIMDGKVPNEEFVKYLNNIQWFGNTFNAHVSASFTPATFKMLPKVKKRRDELYKQYKEEVKNGDVVASVKITDELLKIAKEELKDNVGMQIYDSQCKPSFGNVYKAMFVSRGPVWNAAENRFDISEKAFIDGMDKNDVPIYANSVINGAYPKAVATQQAGYETKKLFACNQAITADEKGTDCKSKAYREVIVDKKNIKKLIKRYYMNGTKLERLERDTLSKMIGKKIKIRSPLYCTSTGGKICNKCLGDLPYILGTKNIGLTSSSIGSGLLNLLMKAFHDTTQSLNMIDIDSIYIE